jgi:GntR family transcriptional regulator
LEQHTGAFVSLYHFLESHYHIHFKDAWESLSAIGASFMEAQSLRVPVGSPLLRSRRITTNERGPVECSVAKLMPDKYEYSVYLNGR